MMQKLKELIKQLQEKGLAIIILQDPTTKLPSLTFTMALVAFITDQLHQTDASANSLIIASGLYLGRKITNSKSSIDGQGK
jgi:Na+/H+ antiporter NhaD/arsenite permease-like protein